MSFTEIGPGNTTKPTAKRDTTRVFSFIIIIIMNRQLSVVASYESRYLSCPAVSHICRLVFSPSTSILFIWKSTPENRKADFQCLKSRMCQRHLIKCLLWNPPSVV